MRAAPAKTCPSCGERYDADVLFCPLDGTPLAGSRTPSLQPSEPDLYLGMELPGQIRLKHLIGIGSMGRVYKAWQAGIERDVAVKVLHHELSGNNELVQRFHREAKVASRLVHPNVVQVLMTGTLPKTSDPNIGGELYLVMEHLDGLSLLSVLAAAGTGGGEGQALPLPRALHIALQICDAVGEAHAQHIVHRDLKPENVMLVKRGDDPDYAKVLDFGIARLDWADRSGMATQAGLIFGTAKYISPEGAEGQPVGPQADVYSIATMIYQMLAGRTPFEGDSPVALLVQHTHAPPPELRTIARASYVPAPLADVIMQNLSKKPGERSPNARVFGKEIVAAARASGLFSEETLSQHFFSPSTLGPVKLVSKERTKSLELSQDLATKIGGVPARASSKPPSSVDDTLDPNTDRSEVGPSGTLMGASDASVTPGSVRPRASKPPQERSGEANGHAAHARTPSPRSSSSRRSVRPSRPPSRPPPPPADDDRPVPELDFDDGSHGGDDMDGATNARRSGVSSTMQGTEAAALEAPSRRRLTRFAALFAFAMVAVPIVLLGGRHFGAWGGANGAESFDAVVEETRACMTNHAWDAPAGHNVKDLTDALFAKRPQDPRVMALRKEASERIVADVLARKYANDVEGATHLAELAVLWDPGNTIAQNLEKELANAKAPAVEPAPTTSASAKATKKPVGAATREPREPKTPSSANAGPTTTPPPNALPPPPTPPTQAPATPPPSSSGPWL